MILSILHHDPLKKILIPILLFLLVSFLNLSNSNSNSISCPNNSSSSNITTINNNFSTMKIHPLPKKRTLTDQNMIHHHKKLRRLPHTFNRVLELPLKSDANVLIEERLDFFRFVVPVPDSLCGEDVRAHAIEIHPGVVKIVVRGSGGGGLLQLDDLKLDRWRYRLPATTRPERATAVCVAGELIVTVPKTGELQKDGDDENWGAGLVYGDAVLFWQESGFSSGAPLTSNVSLLSYDAPSHTNSILKERIAEQRMCRLCLMVEIPTKSQYNSTGLALWPVTDNQWH